MAARQRLRVWADKLAVESEPGLTATQLMVRQGPLRCRSLDFLFFFALLHPGSQFVPLVVLCRCGPTFTASLAVPDANRITSGGNS
jgi:hypothetical protein